MPVIKNKQKSNRGSSVEVASVLGSSASKIKRKIRDIERLLKNRRDQLPSNVIVENERALSALKLELKNAQYVQVVKNNSKKYHMVRFFEKKKALRKYKQIKKQYEELNDKNDPDNKKELKKLKKSLKNAELDLIYVVNFPKDRKYIALYPNDTNNEDDDQSNESIKKGLLKTEQERTSFKEELQKMIKEHTLPISLQDILDGKNTNNFTTYSSSVDESSIAPDAPQLQQDDEQEDEFFE